MGYYSVDRRYFVYLVEGSPVLFWHLREARREAAQQPGRSKVYRAELCVEGEVYGNGRLRLLDQHHGAKEGAAS